MNKQLYLKLRNNITIKSDLQLAELEISALFNKYKAVYSTKKNNTIFPIEILNSNTRSDDLIGFVCEDNKTDFKRILSLLSFVQEIWSSEKMLSEENLYSFNYGF